MSKVYISPSGHPVLRMPPRDVQVRSRFCCVCFVFGLFSWMDGPTVRPIFLCGCSLSLSFPAPFKLDRRSFLWMVDLGVLSPTARGELERTGSVIFYFYLLFVIFYFYLFFFFLRRCKCPFPWLSSGPSSPCIRALDA